MHINLAKKKKKIIIPKTAEATGNLIGNKIADKITKVSKSCHRISQKQLQMSMKIIDSLRLI